ncbi:PREDICTED: uncharacterized protein LOC104612940 [Nelumbo nucifera]|uniref:DUF7866 domain-containing protein n=2 Tax=Nelumbo nucifera TaxID=4432 RepID=A0A822YWQ4_NELNU|nr:PREDICTED: uncharacterized protein LOC104612940 [Nelumbo nucifera]DAD38524.1 TPA_asm: hypothetical protein HUJ06_012846 [Nelumbo nucifera]
MENFIITNQGRLTTRLTVALCLIIQLIICDQGRSYNSSRVDGGGGGEGLIPVEVAEYRVLTELVEGKSGEEGRSRRRQLAPFQLCLLCKCCTASAGGGDPSTCLSMPCCFGIDCQLPDKPYGVCAFVPKTCNCTSCATS